MKLSNKKFNRYLKETILDFQQMGAHDIVKNLKALLKLLPEKMEILDIEYLISIIYGAKDKTPILLADIEIEKEHQYMLKYLEQFFVITYNMGLILIEKKNK